MKFLVLVSLLALGAFAAPYRPASKDAIKDEYIVILSVNHTVDDRDAMIHRVEQLGGETLHSYHIGTFIGFATRGNEKVLAFLVAHPMVQYIEQNQEVHLDQTTTCTEQSGSTWGLSRISHPNAAAADMFKYPDTDGDGEGVYVYVIDTGIRLTHNEFRLNEFGTRASFGVNEIFGETDEDCNGHGTHVAGTIGGITYGVAKKSNLVAVKVLNCGGSGSFAGVIAGINFAASNCATRGTNLCVANLSLGGGQSDSVDGACDSAVDNGVVMVVAAGNSNADACSSSPAASAKSITVGSTQEQGNLNLVDQRSSFSNYGSCVDIFAPGSGVQSSYYLSDTSVATLSGTSMASPHVAGVSAQYVVEGSVTAAVDMMQKLKDTADKDTIHMNCNANCVSTTTNEMLQALPC